MSTNSVFLDTAYAIALASITDQHHDRALEVADWIDAQRIPLITTRAVVIEIGNALAKLRYRAEAVQLLNALERDISVEIIALSEPLYAQALLFFESRQDKEWGLTDCISFVVMQQRGIVDALTADSHFQQAGFNALLLQRP